MTKKRANKQNRPKVYELTILLANTTPSVWRKILAHEFIELSELHLLIQMTMGWEARHLHSFEIAGKSYVDSDSASEMEASLDEEGVLLSDVIGGLKKFKYIYDFGDNWVHEIEISQTLEHDPRLTYPVCIAGENACPPEDCGGAPGFQDLKLVLTGKDSPRKSEMISWLGGFYDPTTFDPNFVNRHFLWADLDEE